MVITIYYKAVIEWYDTSIHKTRKEMCDVVHKVNVDRMETVDLDWEPVRGESPKEDSEETLS